MCVRIRQAWHGQVRLSHQEEQILVAIVTGRLHCLVIVDVAR